MIIPAFFMASMVGFHVEFSQSMYSSKCPYSTRTESNSVTGPSVYWRTSRSWARALSESEETARHTDKIMVRIIILFTSCDVSLLGWQYTDARSKIRQLHGCFWLPRRKTISQKVSCDYQ